MAINKPAVLEAGFPEDVAYGSRFFGKSHRCRVVFVNMGLNPYCIEKAYIYKYS